MHEHTFSQETRFNMLPPIPEKALPCSHIYDVILCKGADVQLILSFDIKLRCSSLAFKYLVYTSSDVNRHRIG